MVTLSSYALTAAAVAATPPALWLLSLRLRDSSIVDIFWGAGFVMVAWITFGAASGDPLRSKLTAGLTTVWGLRLAGYLAWRNIGKGEDPRYRAMRARHGDRWPLRSLFIVFGLQGALMWIISLPVQASVRSSAALGPLDAAGAVVTLAGIFFESVGDLQLARFKADPNNRGKVMDRGLWRYTRHPNYFGDFLVWWGLYMLAAGAGAYWTAVGPVIMTILLRRVSGVTLLEQGMRKKPGYDDYIRRTNAFFPWLPRD